MKVILIVFAVFHYDGGAASSTVPFASMALCEAARAKMDASLMRPDGFGRPRLFSVCVENQ